MTSKQVRCAVYTRKSSEEGLEQSFNSLEAQREACCAFILSQKHEGWAALGSRYDDGGFSGGNVERPALKQLLADIEARKVDTVVVYKVDRLTRSLMDFSKIIEVFDSHGVSFVSVTQQFNTTTSMGRLTLNVLLSFAQFEREVTGERIRDKVAASKKKGMWMGGMVPLGYDCVDHRLITNKSEADTVREIFREYLRLGSVKKLKDYLNLKQIRSKRRTSIAGRTSGGATYSRGALYHLLNNRVYVGEIVHRDQSYPGQHEPIIPHDLWAKVAAGLQANNQGHRRKESSSTPSLLRGIVFDPSGVRFTPTHAVKKGKRYRYYTSQATVQKTSNKPAIARFPAQELENLIIARIRRFLESHEERSVAFESPDNDVVAERAEDMASRWAGLETSTRHEFIRKVVRRVVIGQSAIWVEVERTKLMDTLLERKAESGSDVGGNGRDPIKLRVDFQTLRRGGELRLEGQTGSCFERAPVSSLVKAVARARDWSERITSGEVATVSQLAKETGLNISYAKRILRCARLSPAIMEAVLSGKHRADLTLQGLFENTSFDWLEQHRSLRLS